MNPQMSFNLIKVGLTDGQYDKYEGKQIITVNDSASSGNAGGKPIRNPEREKPQWEDTITNRMIH